MGSGSPGGSSARLASIVEQPDGRVTAALASVRRAERLRAGRGRRGPAGAAGTAARPSCGRSASCRSRGISTCRSAPSSPSSSRRTTRPGRGRVPQRGPEAAPGLVGALDVEVVGPREARGGPLLGVRVLRVVEGEGTEVGLAVLDAPVEDVHVAHEADHEGRRRPVEDLLRRADLLDAALVHDHDAVGHLERLLLVVGHEDAGEADLVVQPPQPAAQLLADLGVERAEGLVEEEHARLDREGAGEGDALALAAGELRGQAVGEPVELDHAQEAHHLLADLRLRGPGARGAARAGRRPRSRRRSCGGRGRSAGRRSRRGGPSRRGASRPGPRRGPGRGRAARARR